MRLNSLLRLLMVLVVAGMLLAAIAAPAYAQVEFTEGCAGANAGNDRDGNDEDNTLISERNSDTQVCVDGQSEEGG